MSDILFVLDYSKLCLSLDKPEESAYALNSSKQCKLPAIASFRLWCPPVQHMTCRPMFHTNESPAVRASALAMYAEVCRAMNR